MPQHRYSWKKTPQSETTTKITERYPDLLKVENMNTREIQTVISKDISRSVLEKNTATAGFDNEDRHVSTVRNWEGLSRPNPKKLPPQCAARSPTPADTTDVDRAKSHDNHSEYSVSTNSKLRNPLIKVHRDASNYYADTSLIRQRSAPATMRRQIKIDEETITTLNQRINEKILNPESQIFETDKSVLTTLDTNQIDILSSHNLLHRKIDRIPLPVRGKSTPSHIERLYTGSTRSPDRNSIQIPIITTVSERLSEKNLKRNDYLRKQERSRERVQVSVLQRQSHPPIPRDSSAGQKALITRIGSESPTSTRKHFTPHSCHFEYGEERFGRRSHITTIHNGVDSPISTRRQNIQNPKLNFVPQKSCIPMVDNTLEILRQKKHFPDTNNRSTGEILDMYQNGIHKKVIPPHAEYLLTPRGGTRSNARGRIKENMCQWIPSLPPRSIGILPGWEYADTVPSYSPNHLGILPGKCLDQPLPDENGNNDLQRSHKSMDPSHISEYQLPIDDGHNDLQRSHKSMDVHHVSHQDGELCRESMDPGMFRRSLEDYHVQSHDNLRRSRARSEPRSALRSSAIRGGLQNFLEPEQRTDKNTIASVQWLNNGVSVTHPSVEYDGFIAAHPLDIPYPNHPPSVQNEAIENQSFETSHVHPLHSNPTKEIHLRRSTHQDDVFLPATPDQSLRECRPAESSAPIPSQPSTLSHQKSQKLIPTLRFNTKGTHERSHEVVGINENESLHAPRSLPPKTTISESIDTRTVESIHNPPIYNQGRNISEPYKKNDGIIPLETSGYPHHVDKNVNVPPLKGDMWDLSAGMIGIQPCIARDNESTRSNSVTSLGRKRLDGEWIVEGMNRKQGSIWSEQGLEPKITEAKPKIWKFHEQHRNFQYPVSRYSQLDHYGQTLERKKHFPIYNRSSKIMWKQIPSGLKEQYEKSEVQEDVEMLPTENKIKLMSQSKKQFQQDVLNKNLQSMSADTKPIKATHRDHRNAAQILQHEKAGGDRSFPLPNPGFRVPRDVSDKNSFISKEQKVNVSTLSCGRSPSHTSFSTQSSRALSNSRYRPLYQTLLSQPLGRSQQSSTSQHGHNFHPPERIVEQNRNVTFLSSGIRRNESSSGSGPQSARVSHSKFSIDGSQHSNRPAWRV